MKELRFTEKGPVFVEELAVSSDTKFEMPNIEEEVPVVFKDIMLYALRKRVQHCIKDLEDNSSRIISTNTSCIEYYREDGTYNSFNNLSYEAMLKAIKLIENGQFNDLTAMQLNQLAKALYWIKPVNKDKITFAQLISYILDQCIFKSMELVQK